MLTLNQITGKEDGRKGKNAWNWKGGISGYVNGREMKKNRILAIKKYGDMCNICKLRKFDVCHHIDLTKHNHSVENLLPVCYMCHKKIHNGNRNTLFTRKYNKKAIEISKILNTTIANVYTLHRMGILIDCLDRKLNCGATVNFEKYKNSY